MSTCFFSSSIRNKRTHWRFTIWTNLLVSLSFRIEMPEPSPPEHVYGISKWADLGRSTLDMIYLRPVRWFHRNFVERFRGAPYPYYHRKFNEVKTVDECEIEDQICFYEAEMTYLREKRIDTMIVEILHDRLARCVVYEGRIDGLDKCAKEKDALFESHTNLSVPLN